MEHIDSAYAQFRYIEDLKGQLEMLSKKATIMHWRGDLVLANDTATQFLELKKQYADTKLWVGNIVVANHVETIIADR